MTRRSRLSEKGEREAGGPEIPWSVSCGRASEPAPGGGLCWRETSPCRGTETRRALAVRPHKQGRQARVKVDRHGGLDGQGDAENTSVTAVICTYNGARVIPRALEALSQQTFYGPAEVVVVDNNSQDGVAEEAERYWNALNKPPFPMRCIEERQPGIAFARRTGVMTAKSEVIVFCDDDNLLSPDYFARAVKALAIPALAPWSGAACRLPTATFRRSSTHTHVTMRSACHSSIPALSMRGRMALRSRSNRPTKGPAWDLRKPDVSQSHGSGWLVGKRFRRRP